jgi:hypothetical protein
MEGYKVVALRQNKYQSVNTCGDGNVIYVPGEDAVPNFDCGPLGVFGKQKDAVKFMTCQYKRQKVMSDFERLVLFTCEFEESTQTKFWTWFYDHSLFRLRKDQFPKGTFFADSVILKEKIEVNYKHD